MPKRIETGVVQFGEDWPGVFIRGDDAFAYLQSIRKFLKEIPKSQDVSGMVARNHLESLGRLLEASNVSSNSSEAYPVRVLKACED